MREPDSVTEAMQLLEAEGYECSLTLGKGELRFSGTDHACPVARAVVEKMYRFEGPSDPGDEMVVFGVVDPGTGLRGVLASAFGPAADPEMIEGLSYLSSKVDHGPET